jgi:hypothetical protein
MDDPPAGWQVWNAEPGGPAVFVFRPDVFDSDAFPAACLPTVRVTRGSPGQKRRRAGRAETGWGVALFMEPEVRVRACDRSVGSREDALEAARAVMAAFAAGEIDYRGAYQVPREAYLEELDALVG